MLEPLVRVVFIRLDYVLDPVVVGGRWVTPLVDGNPDIRGHLIG